MPDVTDLRRAYLRNGYQPVPILSGQKFPTAEDWIAQAENATPESVAAWPDWCSSTGILCGTVLGVDSDIADPVLAEQVEAAAIMILGMSPLRRVGRAPRWLIPYRAAEPGMRWAKTPKLVFLDRLDPRTGKPEEYHVEVRATGQQFVADGIHPDTGRPYAWDGPTPADVPVSDLPEITDAQVCEFLAECERLIRAAGGVGDARGPVRTAPGHVVKSLSDLAPPDAATVVDLLDRLPNPAETGRGTWIQVMLSAKGCIDGLAAVGRLGDFDADAIRDAACRWAARWPDADGFEAELEKWERDWSRRDAPLAGWRNLETLAGRAIPGLRHETAAREFSATPPPAAPADPDGWRHMLARTEKGKIEAGLANALLAVRHAPDWRGVLAYDEFANRVFLVAPPPWQGGTGPVADYHATLAAEWLCNQGIKVSSGVAAEVLVAIAMENRVHPVRAFLRGLAWDGAPRADTWLCDFLGVADTPLTRAFAAKFLIAAVARVMQPGCQVDTVLTLEGEQGIRKSTALETLFSKPWFTDRLPDLHTKDAQQQLAGKWCVEHAEMATLSRADVSTSKAYMSARVDTYRPSYGRFSQDFPRQCVFAATVNPGGLGYLRDETGARRIWPVACGAGWAPGRKVDTARLLDLREQLWAEAVARYDAREAWWLDRHEQEQEQAEAASERYDADVWADTIAEIVAGQNTIRTADICSKLGIQTRDQTKIVQMRIAGVLRAMGWTRQRRRLEGEPAWLFVRPVGPDGAEVVPLQPRSDMRAIL